MFTRNNFIAIVCTTFFAIDATAQYSVALIKPALKEHAGVIVRLYEQDVLVKNKGNAIVRNHYVYTILNPGGDGHAEFVTHYDKLKKVINVDGKLYNDQGVKVRSVKRGEIKDYSNSSESNLADDDRVKQHDFNQRTYPYTVEYESVVEYNGILHLPAWMPVFDEKVAVEKSTLSVVVPQEYQLRFKSFNYEGAPVVTQTHNSTAYRWEINNYNAVEKEVYSPSWHEITPTVFLAPSAFEIQRYEGNMNNWQEFGDFMYKLNAGRDQLPGNIKQKVHQLTDGLTDDRKKIEVLYKYLQQNTRYISIQLGIGGWQTLDANFVATNGYGDCKALTNYMYAILKEAGIRSLQTLIYAGPGEQMRSTEFTSNQFNHVVLCVPQPTDSIWLECTSQTDQPGYMGSFTGNRQALAVDEKKSTLVQTPVYGAKENLQLRYITASLNEEGLLKANITTDYLATQQDRIDAYLNNYSKEQLRDYMRNKFKLSSYEIENFSHEKKKEGLPGINEKVTIQVNNYASVSGKRLFISPNILSVSSFKIKDAATRRFDFNITSPFTDIDTVLINIPPGYKPESIPKDTEYKTAAAHYRSSIKLDNDKIIYTRYYTQLAARMPASKATELADFFDKIYKADHAKIVFIKEGL